MSLWALQDVTHFECAMCAFGGLGQIRLPKLDIELVNKLTPITTNRWFRVHNQYGLTPKHSDVREIGCSIRHPWAIGRKLVRSAVKGHNTADDERV